jgi:succinoglycan biosynthesis transport protein ExoP
MTLAQLWVVLQGRWRAALAVAAGVFALIMAASVLLWFFMPNYTASAAVVLDVKSPDPIAGIVLPGMNVSSYMATQVEVMESDRVALRAIDTLKLDHDRELRDDWMSDTDGRGDFRAWLVERISRKLDAKPGRESNTITVKYTAHDPERAARVANAFVDAYIDVTLQLRVEPAVQYNAVFDDRSRQLREALELAQSRLSVYQREHGIIASDERLDVENQRMTELSAQLVLLQGAAAEASSRHQQAHAGGNAMPEALTNPVVAALSAELARQQATLQQLNSRLGDQHPQVIELKANIAELNTRLAAASQSVNSSLSVNDNVNQERLKQARSAVEDQRARLLKLKAQRDESEVLTRDVENAQKAYDAVATRLNQSRIESQNTQTNVSVLKRATTPPFPSSPNLLLCTAAGVLLALLTGAMTAILREQRDQRLRTDDDVRLLLKQPLLGVLPLRKGALRRNPSRRRLGGPETLVPAMSD